MCNLYSITTNQAAIAALFRRMNRYVGNLPPMPGVFPDYPAKSRDQEEGRCLVCARRKSPAVLLRRHLDRVQRRARHEVEAYPRPSPRLWFPDDFAERHRRADPSEGDAGDPDQ